MLMLWKACYLADGSPAGAHPKRSTLHRFPRSLSTIRPLCRYSKSSRCKLVQIREGLPIFALNTLNGTTWRYLMTNSGSNSRPSTSHPASLNDSKPYLQ